MLKINISNVEPLTTKRGPRVRFSVTILDGEEPLQTTHGFLYTDKRIITTPQVRLQSGKYYTVADVHPRVLLALAKWLGDNPQVQQSLGPVPEQEKYQKREKLVEGEVEL